MSCPARYNCVTLGSYPGYILSTNLVGKYDGNVLKVQKALSQMSAYPDCGNLDPGPCDGYYGTGTASAVRDFQAMGWDKGLVEDGKVGPQTWAVLASCHS